MLQKILNRNMDICEKKKMNECVLEINQSNAQPDAVQNKKRKCIFKVIIIKQGPGVSLAMGASLTV